MKAPGFGRSCPTRGRRLWRTERRRLEKQEDKAKGKILLEKGKVSYAKSAIGAYVYETRKNGGALDESRLAELCAEVDKHLQEIERLREDAKKSGEDISGAFDSMTDSAAPETAEAETEVKPETPAAE